MTDDQERDELAGASRGYYKIPDAQKRAAMSPEEIAVELSKCKRDTPSYIVLSHELSLKIAQEEAKLNQRIAKIAGAFTILGAIIGGAATAFFSSQAPQTVVNCNCYENRTAPATQSPSEISNRRLVTPKVPLDIKNPDPSAGKQNSAERKQKQ